MKKISTTIIFVFFLSFWGFAQSWNELGTGADALLGNYSIQSIVNDGKGNIYASVGNVASGGNSYYVVKWNGTSWSEVATGSNALKATNSISTLALDGAGNLYAAGAFLDQNNYPYVAKWNGTSWTELGTGTNALNPNGNINYITTDKSGNVYAGGQFTDAGGKYYVAKWDGTSWTELGTAANALNANSVIVRIVTDASGNVYAGGDFTNVSNYNYVAKWNGTSWTELGSGSNALNANGIILSMLIDSKNNIYAGGYFSDANNAQYVAKWNGSSWAELGTGANALNANGGINALALDSLGNIYAAGAFYQNGNQNIYYVSQWNGTIWSELGGSGKNALNANNEIFTLATDKSGNIYAGGLFTNTDQLNYVAEWGTGTAATSTKQPINETLVSIYPNPGPGLVNLTNITEDVQLTVFNILGETVSNQQISYGNTLIDLSQLHSGVYTLTFNGRQYLYSSVKWVKE